MVGMNLEQSVKAILEPYVSEKSTRTAEKHRQVAFKVVPSATKPLVKKAIEKIFKVKVESVQMLKVKPKTKRTRSGMGTRQGWKKAYVKLADGHDIDFTKPVEGN